MSTTIYWVTLEDIETGKRLRVISSAALMVGVEVSLPYEKDRSFHTFLLTECDEETFDDLPFD